MTPIIHDTLLLETTALQGRSDSDLSGRPTDRRCLAGPSFAKVVLQWMQLVLQDNG